MRVEKVKYALKTENRTNLKAFTSVIYASLNTLLLINILRNITINNYFTGTVKGNYLTKGSRDQFGPKNIPSVARDSFKTKLVKGTRV